MKRFKKKNKILSNLHLFALVFAICFCFTNENIQTNLKHNQL